MKFLQTLAMAALIAAPLQSAFATEEVTDFQGNKIVLEEGEVSNKGVKIHTYTVGKGPVLIISHGNGDGWFGWTNQLHMLSQKYKVVLYDLRNFNKSDKVLGIENGIDANFEEDLLAVQNKFTDGPAVHMGNDQGGMVLWMYAMKHPEKVKLLIQTNTIHPRAFIRELSLNAEQAKLSWYIQRMIEDGKNPPRPNVVPAAVRPGDTPSMTALRQAAAQRTGDEGRQGTVDWYRANFPGKPYTPGSRAFGSFGTEFPHVKAPTLVVAALTDQALCPCGYNDLGTWIDAEYQFVTWPDGVGSHFQHSQYPERFNKLIGNWLAFNDTAK